MSPVRLTFLTTLAMLAFAANSLLNRMALTETGLDAGSFTLIRVFSAAAFLVLLTLLRGRSATALVQAGSWPSALVLLLYAAGFSFAYLHLTAATGALLLFGAVQATMIAWGLWCGERPNRLQLGGLLAGFSGVVWLLFPGVSAPPLPAAMLMAVAGVGWGIYSLRGKSSSDAVSSSAANFARASLLAAGLWLVLFTANTAGITDFVFADITGVSAAGVACALASGVLASGAGYALWYGVLPHMQATTAATVQLTVPAITAVAGVLIAGEAIDSRLFMAFVLIIGGVAVFIRCRH
ncbi:MAG: EamA family transporter [Oceanospirillaceae bacterium]|nr:EamA family transporter [Oceanospirillaceae bacterium]MBT11475.1 EamA family transporter [Oceanospirillaceae bacterium]|tara:strand:- start:13325 stop:14209 length:885 start_codon:yes stop_codon:yes gene_type:complete